MKRGSIGDWGNSGDERGGSIVLGFVLLFGMVLAGAVLIAVVAGPLLDSVQTETNRERAHMEMNQIDHAFSTATVSDDPQPVGVSPDALSIVDDGSIAVEWFDATDDEPFSGTDTADCRASGELRALEYELEDGTVVHQGGGIWEETGSETSVVSEPQISYDGDSLRLHIMQLDEGAVGGDELTAKSDHSKATALTEDIRAAAANCSEADIAFRIESSYHEAWYTYLEKGLEADEYADEVTVRHRPDESAVEAEVRGVRDVRNTPELIVTEDYGLQGDAVVGENRVVHPDHRTPTPSLQIAAQFENTGGENLKEDLEFRILDEDVSETIRNEEFASGERKNITFELSPGSYRHDLEPGQRYEYDVLTPNDSLSETGAFYVGRNGVHFERVAPETESEIVTETNETAAIGLDVRNVGVENAENVDAELVFEDLTDDDGNPLTATIDGIDIGYGTERSLEWTMNRSSLPAGDNEFRIEVGGQEVGSGTIDGTASSDEGAFIVVEDGGVDDPTVSRDQVVVSDSEAFTISADVTSTYRTDGETGTVTATILDTGVEVNESIRLDSTETKTVEFEVDTAAGDFEPGTVYEYDVRANGTGLSETGSFYVGKRGTHYDATTEMNESENGSVIISTDVRNVGIDDAENVTATLTFDDVTDEDGEPLTATIEGLDIDYGTERSLEWTINRTKLPPVANDATIDIGGQTVWNGTVTGARNGDGNESIVVVEDGGVDDPSLDRPQIVRNDGGNVTVSAVVASTYLSEDITENATVTIPDAGVEIEKAVTLDSGERTTVEFAIDPDEHGLENGTVYAYDVQIAGSGLDETGSFYVGRPGSHFAVSNGTATVGDTVTISAAVHNVGIDDDDSSLTFDLEYVGDEELEGDPYEGVEINDSVVQRSFGENGSIELEFNSSVLVSGEYEATIATDDDEERVNFTVTAGVDPGRVGLGEVDNATVDISVLSSQVSGTYEGDHRLGSMTLEVLTERNGETESEYLFENPEGGRNINTYPAWQDKSHHAYNTTIEIDEEATLTLASRSYGLPQQTAGCDRRQEAKDYFFGMPINHHYWCADFDDSSEDYLVEPIDATADEQEQNLRVRTAEDNDLPALYPGNEEQESVDEILSDVTDPVIARDSLWSDGELDLQDNEFIFLFETTTECGMDDSGCDADNTDIDALWENAKTSDSEGDPNFNDLIVYVKVERANVDPGKPSITITPGGGESTAVDAGDGSDVGAPGGVSGDLEGSATDPDDELDVDRGSGTDPATPDSVALDPSGSVSGDDELEIGPGDSNSDREGGDGSGEVRFDGSGLDLRSDYIVVG